MAEGRSNTSPVDKGSFRRYPRLDQGFSVAEEFLQYAILQDDVVATGL